MKLSVSLIFLCVMHLSFAQTQRMIPIGYHSADDPAEKKDPPYEVSGRVIDVATGEPLVGANIYIERQKIGASTDETGAFKLILYTGFYKLQISSTGYETDLKTINVLGSGKINFLLKDVITELDEVTIRASNTNVINREVGKEVLSISSIKELPPIGGEADIMKSLALLPGVIIAGEASSGFNVRGGGSDQNLILMDGAPLYNPSHMFGFFSAFNPNIIRDVSLYKGSIPSNYGGRGSSVVDITYKKGNFDHWVGDATLGMVSSKFSAGGPIIRDKLSVMVGGRGSYVNWLLKQAGDADVQNSRASFYDGNVILSYAMNPKNEIEYSLYYSNDSFRFAGDTTYQWQTRAQVIKWNSTLTDHLSLHLTAIQSDYEATIKDEARFTAFDLETGILDNQIGLDFTLKPNERHTLKIGGQMKWIKVDPGTFIPREQSTLASENIISEKAQESGLFVQHNFEISKKLSVSYGVRWSNFRLMGLGSVNSYNPELQRSIENKIGETDFGNNDLIKQYNGIEPRLSFNYKLNPDLSLKGGYNRMNQYIHQVSNTNSISPVDTWKLSGPFLKPEIIDQYSIGLFRSLDKGNVEASIEGYYKDWDNVVDFKDGAELFLNDHLETELLTGKGKSYGFEAFLKKKDSRLNGWISYTFSRSLRKFDGPFKLETINRGDWYPSNFDKPHNFSMVTRYRFGAFTTMSTVLTVSTGRPLTTPGGKWTYQGQVLGAFNERNNGRIPDYHRLDVSLQFKWPSPHKVLAGQWTLAVYNIYGRKNAFSVFFKDTLGAPPQPFRVSVIGAPFPSLSYEITF